ncbi:hypothetical protein Celaphus_00006354 [Cervus elaphus hippelaphus]|uniref:Uncharacterized protein n=1 Tax=Cervus elaphus hippelaphus TaxID=46360 RepID=A0A212CTR1_CEREH|nr:hypothetical protein Celaphus_00006354 [Cervus elaphus hippelaphus]
MCPEGIELAADNVTCMGEAWPSLVLDAAPRAYGGFLSQFHSAQLNPLPPSESLMHSESPASILLPAVVNYGSQALARGVFGEAYEGLVIGFLGTPASCR